MVDAISQSPLPTWFGKPLSISAAMFMKVKMPSAMIAINKKCTMTSSCLFIEYSTSLDELRAMFLHGDGK